MSKLNFEETIERINEGRPVQASQVLASALNRKVWLAEWHLPGCLSESQAILTTKEAAIECALGFMEDPAPRGAKTDLRRFGSFQYRTALYGTVITTVHQRTLGDLL
jgi:hypothetical protein